MKWLAFLIALLFLSCCVENTELLVPNSIGEVVQFASADGSVVIRPTMKYDIFECMLIAVGSDADFDLAPFGLSGSFLSEEGLKFQKFARERISDKLVEDIKQYIMFGGRLNVTSNQWWPQHLMWGCPLTNDIDKITGYIRNTNDTDIRFAGDDVKDAIIEDRAKIAETIEKFWDEIFYSYYSDFYPRLVNQCKDAIKGVDSSIRNHFSDLGVLGFMEKWSGHRFDVKTRMVLYPDPFMRVGAYALEEPDEPFVSSVHATVPSDSWMTTPLHEFSHKLLRDLFHSEEFIDAANGIEPTEYDINLFRGYSDMRGVVEEYCVAAFDVFLKVKAGFIKENEALQHQYYRTDLCLDLTEHLLKNHKLGEDIGETFLEFLRSKTK